MSVRGKLINKLFKNATQLAKNYDYIVKCDTDLCSEISFLFAYDLETCEDKDIRSFIENKFKNLPEGCSGVGGSEFDGVVITNCSFTINPIEVINVCSTEMDILEYGTVYLKGIVKANGEVEATPTISKLMTSTAKTNSVNTASVYLSVVLLYTAIAKGISTGIEKITRVINGKAVAKATSNPFIKLTRVVSSNNIVNSISDGLTTIAKNISSLNKTNSISSGSTQIAKLISSTSVALSKIVAEIEIRSAGIIGVAVGIGVSAGQVVKAVLLNSISTTKSIVNNVLSIARSITSSAKSNSIAQGTVVLIKNISSNTKGIAISFGNAITGVLEGIAKTNSTVIANVVKIINLTSISIVKESSTATAFLTRVLSTGSSAYAKIISTANVISTIVGNSVSKAITSAIVSVTKTANATANSKARVVSNAQISILLTATAISKALSESVGMIKLIVVSALSKNNSIATGSLKLTKSLKLNVSSNTTFASTLSVTTPSASDPNWANVTLLLRGNSSPITDEKAGYTFTTQGTTPSISTSDKKFGAGSISFAGNGYIKNETYDDTFAGFGSGNFTIEFWIKFNSVEPTQVICGIVSSGGDSTGGLVVYINASGNLRVFGGSVSPTANTSVSTGVWYFIAITKSSNVWRLYKDGVYQSKFTDSAAVAPQSTKPFTIGGYGTTAYLNALLDDFRITKGIARYTTETSFTPPTAEFPNS